MRTDILKKPYYSPEFDYVHLVFDAAICISNNETPGTDEHEIDDDDNP